MMENAIELTEEQATPPASGERKEEGKGIRLTDIYTEEGIRNFSKALELSDGNCIFLVHAFFPFFQVDHSILEDPRKEKLKNYVDGLKSMVQKARAKSREKKIPVLAMVRGEVGQIRRGSGKKLEKAKERLRKDLGEFIELEDDDIFFIVTHQETPIPLLAGKDEREYLHPSGLPNYKKIIIDFINRLKEAGLSRAVIAGTNLGGDRYFGKDYRSAEHPSMHGIFTDEEWKLKDYYASKGKARPHLRESDWKHPFEKISPEGCVAEIIRALAYGGVKVGVSQATYPQKIPKTSQLERSGISHFEVKSK